MQRFTDAFIRSVEPNGQTTNFKDAEIKEFCFRVTKSGVKTFFVLLGSGRRHTIGRYPQVSLRAAREEAKRLLAERVLGVARPMPAVLLSEAKQRFLADCRSRLRPNTLDSYERMLRLHLPFDHQTLDAIKPQQIIAHISKLAPTNQEHATRVGKTFFRWCLRQHLIERNPMELLQAPKGRSRERVLEDLELAAVYHTACAGSDSYSRLVAFLIRSGARRGEAGGLQTDWINEREAVIVFPGHATKNKRVHTVPYLASWELLEANASRPSLVFPGQGGKPIGGWTQLKRAFDARHGAKDYTLHDLRRTFSSGLARLSVPIHVTEKLLNHVSGTHSGVQAIYNRYSYLDEMRDALLRWDEHLRSLPPPKG